MKQYVRESVKWTSICFIAIIIYCILSIIDKFSYLDLAYLVVVICFFAVYLKRVSEL